MDFQFITNKFLSSDPILGIVVRIGIVVAVLVIGLLQAPSLLQPYHHAGPHQRPAGIAHAADAPGKGAGGAEKGVIPDVERVLQRKQSALGSAVVLGHIGGRPLVGLLGCLLPGLRSGQSVYLPF